VVTVFGRTNFLGGAGFQPDWHAVTVVREAEDRAFSARVGTDLSHWHFPEAALRLGPSADDIFDGSPYRDVVIPRGLRHRLCEVTRRFRPACIVAPLGLGGHADHLVISRVAAEVARACKTKLIYYEDLPYAARLGGRRIRRHAKTLNTACQPVCVRLGPALAAKMRAIRLYRTQITRETLTLIRHHALRLHPDGAERLWIPTEAFPSLRGVFRDWSCRRHARPRAGGVHS
jgi:LmbE family N-acetylglucosaminyl deacetylase